MCLVCVFVLIILMSLLYSVGFFGHTPPGVIFLNYTNPFDYDGTSHCQPDV